MTKHIRGAFPGFTIGGQRDNANVWMARQKTDGFSARIAGCAQNGDAGLPDGGHDGISIDSALLTWGMDAKLSSG
jgi:hypothetical protein